MFQIGPRFAISARSQAAGGFSPARYTTRQTPRGNLSGLSMIKIEAIIRHHKLDEIKTALVAQGFES
jgi:hypothetical protein